jgi:hypothetical protein
VTRIFALLLCVLATSDATAADLNAPVINQPTIGSEIARGLDAANTCSAETDPLYLSKCAYDVSSANRQRESNSKPFELGLFFGTWHYQTILVDVANDLPDNGVAQAKVPNAQAEAHDMFVLFRKIQRDLHITDAQLVAACPFTPEGRVMMQTKISEWANSHPEGQ